jgi:predicted RNase H-like HicB family nuclease
MEYAVVIEKGPKSFGAYVPDLPGCIAVGETRAEAVQLIQEAIKLHLLGLQEQGERVPSPLSTVEIISVAV